MKIYILAALLLTQIGSIYAVNNTMIIEPVEPGMEMTNSTMITPMMAPAPGPMNMSRVMTPVSTVAAAPTTISNTVPQPKVTFEVSVNVPATSDAANQLARIEDNLRTTITEYLASSAKVLVTFFIPTSSSRRLLQNNVKLGVNVFFPADSTQGNTQSIARGFSQAMANNANTVLASFASVWGPVAVSGIQYSYGVQGTPAAAPKASSHLSGGAIAGIVIGSVAGAAILAGVAFGVYKKGPTGFFCCKSAQ